MIKRYIKDTNTNKGHWTGITSYEQNLEEIKQDIDTIKRNVSYIYQHGTIGGGSGSGGGSGTSSEDAITLIYNNGLTVVNNLNIIYCGTNESKIEFYIKTTSQVKQYKVSAKMGDKILIQNKSVNSQKSEFNGTIALTIPGITSNQELIITATDNNNMELIPVKVQIRYENFSLLVSGINSNIDISKLNSNINPLICSFTILNQIQSSTASLNIYIDDVSALSKSSSTTKFGTTVFDYNLKTLFNEALKKQTLIVGKVYVIKAVLQILREGNLVAELSKEFNIILTSATAFSQNVSFNNTISWTKSDDINSDSNPEAGAEANEGNDDEGDEGNIAGVVSEGTNNDSELDTPDFDKIPNKINANIDFIDNKATITGKALVFAPSAYDKSTIPAKFCIYYKNETGEVVNTEVVKINCNKNIETPIIYEFKPSASPKFNNSCSYFYIIFSLDIPEEDWVDSNTDPNIGLYYIGGFKASDFVSAPDENPLDIDRTGDQTIATTTLLYQFNSRTLNSQTDYIKDNTDATGLTYHCYSQEQIKQYTFNAEAVEDTEDTEDVEYAEPYIPVNKEAGNNASPTVYVFNSEHSITSFFDASNQFPFELTLNNINSINNGFDSIEKGFKLYNKAYASINHNPFKELTPDSGVTPESPLYKYYFLTKTDGETFPTLNTDFTISFTYKADQTTDLNKTVFDLSSGDESNDSWYGFKATLDTLKIGYRLSENIIGSSDKTIPYKTLSIPLTLNVENTIDIVCSNDSSNKYIKIYLNGVLTNVQYAYSDSESKKNYDFIIPYINSNEIKFAYNIDEDNNIITSDIILYDFKIYRTALTDFEIVQNYINNKYAGSNSTDITELRNQNFIEVGKTSDNKLYKNCKIAYLDPSSWRFQLITPGLNCKESISNAKYGTWADLYETLISTGSCPLPILRLSLASTKDTVNALFSAIHKLYTSNAGNEDTWDLTDITYILPNSNIEYKFAATTGNSHTYYNPANKPRLELQGTSTLNYSAKNFEIYFGQVSTTENGPYSDVLVSPNIGQWLPENRFTLKADAMDSAHTNNAAIGKFINDIENGIFTNLPPRAFNNSIELPAPKATLEGFPILLFIDYGTEVTIDDGYAPLNLSGPQFMGIYSFNLGRGSKFNMGYSVINKVPTYYNGIHSSVEITDTKLPGITYGVDVSNLSNTFCYEFRDNNEKYGSFQSDNTNIIDEFLKQEYPADANYSNLTSTDRSKAAIQEVFKRLANCYGTNEDAIYEYNTTINDYVGENTHYIKTNGEVKIDTVTPKYNESSTYFNWDMLFNPSSGIIDFETANTYFLLAMVFGLADSLHKNMQLRTWESKPDSAAPYLWYPCFYDMDTCLGLDNKGNENILPTASINTYTNLNNQIDVLHSVRVWKDGQIKPAYSCSNNRLWRILTYSFRFSGNSYLQDQVMNNSSWYINKWIEWRKKSVGNEKAGIFSSAANFVDNYFKAQTANVGALVFNLDYKIKYIDPLLVTPTDENAPCAAYKDTTSISFIHGRRYEFVKDWMEKRIAFLDAIFLYDYHDIRNKSITTIAGHNYEKMQNCEYTDISSFTTRTTPHKVTFSVITNKPGILWIYAVSQASSSTRDSNFMLVEPNKKMSMTIDLPSGDANNFYINCSGSIAKIEGLKNVILKQIDKFKMINLEDIDLANVDFTLGSSLASNPLGITGDTIFEKADRLKTINLSNIKTPKNCSLIVSDDNSKLLKVDISNSTINSLNLGASSSALSNIEIVNSKLTNFSITSKPLVKSLDFTNCKQLTEIIIDNLSSLTEITGIESLTSLKTITIINCPNLSKVSILDCKLLNSVTIKHCKNLKYFDCQYCTKDLKIDLIELADDVEDVNTKETTKETKLSHICLHGCYNSSNVLGLPQECCENIEYLDISYTNINAIGYSYNSDKKDNFEYPCSSSDDKPILDLSKFGFTSDAGTRVKKQKDTGNGVKVDTQYYATENCSGLFINGVASTSTSTTTKSAPRNVYYIRFNKNINGSPFKITNSAFLSNIKGNSLIRVLGNIELTTNTITSIFASGAERNNTFYINPESLYTSNACEYNNFSSYNKHITGSSDLIDLTTSNYLENFATNIQLPTVSFKLDSAFQGTAITIHDVYYIMSKDNMQYCTSLQSTFSYCKDLEITTSKPINGSLFSKCANVTTLYRLFQKSFKEFSGNIPDGLFSNLTNCTAIHSWAAPLGWAWNAHVKSWNDTHSQKLSSFSSNLCTIEAALFDKLTSLTTAECALPQTSSTASGTLSTKDLFKGCTNLTNASYFLQYATSNVKIKFETAQLFAKVGDKDYELYLLNEDKAEPENLSSITDFDVYFTKAKPTLFCPRNTNLNNIAHFSHWNDGNGWSEATFSGTINYGIFGGLPEKLYYILSKTTIEDENYQDITKYEVTSLDTTTEDGKISDKLYYYDGSEKVLWNKHSTNLTTCTKFLSTYGNGNIAFKWDYFNNLFRFNKNITNLNNIFEGSYIKKSSTYNIFPKNIFNGLTELTDVTAFFKNHNITHTDKENPIYLPGNMFKDCSKLITIESCFENTYPDKNIYKLAGGGTNTGTNLFYIRLSDINDGYNNFQNTLVTNVSSAFKNAGVITPKNDTDNSYAGIPYKFFYNPKASISNMSWCFAGLYSLCSNGIYYKNTLTPNAHIINSNNDKNELITENNIEIDNPNYSPYDETWDKYAWDGLYNENLEYYSTDGNNTSPLVLGSTQTITISSQNDLINKHIEAFVYSSKRTYSEDPLNSESFGNYKKLSSYNINTELKFSSTLSQLPTSLTFAKYDETINYLVLDVSKLANDGQGNYTKYALGAQIDFITLTLASSTEGSYAIKLIGDESVQNNIIQSDIKTLSAKVDIDNISGTAVQYSATAQKFETKLTISINDNCKNKIRYIVITFSPNSTDGSIDKYRNKKDCTYNDLKYYTTDFEGNEIESYYTNLDTFINNSEYSYSEIRTIKLSKIEIGLTPYKYNTLRTSEQYNFYKYGPFPKEFNSIADKICSGKYVNKIFAQYYSNYSTQLFKKVKKLDNDILLLAANYGLYTDNYIVPADLFKYCTNSCIIDGALSYLGLPTITIDESVGESISYKLCGRIPPMLLEPLQEITSANYLFKNAFLSVSPYYPAYKTYYNNDYDYYNGEMYPINLFANNKLLTHLKGTFENAILSYGVDMSSTSKGSIFKNNASLNNVSKLFAGSHAFNATSNISNSTSLNSDDIRHYKNLMQIEHLFKDLKLNDISYCFAGLNGNDSFTGISSSETSALCNTSNNDIIYDNNTICGIYSETDTAESRNYVASTGMLFTINNIFGENNGQIASNNTIRDVRYAFFGQNSITSDSYLPEFWSISQLSPADRTKCFTGVSTVKNTASMPSNMI